MQVWSVYSQDQPCLQRSACPLSSDLLPIWFSDELDSANILDFDLIPELIFSLASDFFIGLLAKLQSYSIPDFKVLNFIFRKIFYPVVLKD